LIQCFRESELRQERGRGKEELRYEYVKEMYPAEYQLYRVILSVLDPRKCEYLKDCSLDFEHAYMTTYLAS
jgi:hypothetical protein